MAVQSYFGQSNCPCPFGDNPKTVLEDCGIDLQQIVRFAYKKKVGTTPFDGTPTNDILVKADWEAKLGGIGDEIFYLSPLFSNTTISGGDMQKVGEGDNLTVNGAGRKVRLNNSVLTGSFLSTGQDNRQALANLLNCSGNRSQQVYLINNEGTAWPLAGASGTATDMMCVLFSSFGAQTTDGYGTVTINSFEMKFDAKDLLNVVPVDLSSFILDLPNP